MDSTDELQQAFLCGGTWDSWIGNHEDGIFDVTSVDPATGRISGDHIYSAQEKYPFTGWCYHPPPRHFIEITESRPGFTFTYFGEVLFRASGRHRTRDGKRRRNVVNVQTATLAALTEDILDDDEWMGVKTT